MTKDRFIRNTMAFKYRYDAELIQRFIKYWTATDKHDRTRYSIYPSFDFAYRLTKFKKEQSFKN